MVLAGFGLTRKWYARSYNDSSVFTRPFSSCCIDKTSSSELSEAINSMFRWYQKAAVCYAYLADISVTEDQRNRLSFESDLGQSRWFTRGWTLQELLAPETINFYSKDWSLVGTKVQLCSIISLVTGIGQNYLNGEDHTRASISQRMSWASRRNTSRLEDTAYCLLGIFGINMPLIYGEGSKAFRRLQLAIMRTHPEDHTLFAWGTVVDQPSWIVTEKPKSVWSMTPLPWKPPTERPEMMGLLANSPKDFENSHMFVPAPSAIGFYLDFDAALPTEFGNDIIGLDLPLAPSVYYYVRTWDKPKMTQLHHARYVVLLCKHEEDKTCSVAIPLLGNGQSLYTRSREIVFWTDPSSWHPQWWKKSIHIGQPPRFTLQCDDIIIRRELYDSRAVTPSEDVYRFGAERNVDYISYVQVIRDHHLSLGDFCWVELELKEQRRGFRISLGHVQADPKYKWSMSIGLVPFVMDGDEVVDMNGFKWYPMEQASSFDNHLFSRVLACPRDQRILEIDPFPQIIFQVEKLSLDDEQGTFVNAVDILVTARDSDRSLKLVENQDGVLRRSNRQRRAPTRFQ